MQHARLAIQHTYPAQKARAVMRVAPALFRRPLTRHRTTAVELRAPGGSCDFSRRGEPLLTANRQALHKNGPKIWGKPNKLLPPPVHAAECTQKKGVLREAAHGINACSADDKSDHSDPASGPAHPPSAFGFAAVNQ